MALKITRFINLFLAATVVGVTICQVIVTAHRLMSGSAVRQAEALFLHDWDKVIAGAETGALLSAMVVACWVRYQRWSFILTLVGTACLADMVILQTLFRMPSPWQIIFNSADAVFASVGYSALLLAVIVDTPNPPRRKATVTRLAVARPSRDEILQSRRDPKHKKRNVEPPGHHQSL